MKTPIKRIVLDLGGGAEVELTLEQAKTLFSALEEMFGSKETPGMPYPIYIERRRWIWDYPQPHWQSPTITGVAANPFPPGTITFGSGTAQMCDNGTLKLIC